MAFDGDRKAQVAVVGLGAIGLPVCVNLAKNGLTVQAWNRSPAAAEAASQSGAHVVQSLADLDAPVIFVALPDMPEIDEVLDAGLGASLLPGDRLVVLSTVSPVAVRELSARLLDRSVQVVDAPVSGGDVGAQQATLSIMVGAAEEDFAYCKALLHVIGQSVIHLGPVGSGSAAKMANQIVVGATLAALGEALNLTRCFGLSDVAVIDVLSAGMAGSKALEAKRSKLETGDFRPGGAARYQLKDLEHAVSAATDVGLDLEVTQCVRTQFRWLVEHGYGSLDHSAVILASAPTVEEEPPRC